MTDMLALGFLDVARIEFSMRVPEELCVIGFDDIPAAGWLGYDLTTFRQPIDGIADLLRRPAEPPCFSRPHRRFRSPSRVSSSG